MNDHPQNSSEALRYQEQRGLDNVPGYAVGLQFQLSDGPRAYIALSRTELVLYLGSNLAIHYDLKGRLVKVSDQSQFWRRSLSGRVLHSRKLTAEEGGGLERNVLTDGDARTVVQQIQPLTGSVLAAFEDPATAIEVARPSAEEARLRIAPVLRLAAGFDEPAAARDAQQFQAIYGRVAVLPPDQYNARCCRLRKGARTMAARFAGYTGM